MKIGPHYASKITVKDNIVTKKIIKGLIADRCDKDYTDLFDREIWALELLRGYDHFPFLIDYKKHKLEMRMKWVGEPILKLTPDWKEQAKTIVHILDKVGVGHMDIKPKNITVLDGKIHLIDFGKVRPLRDGVGFPKHVKQSHLEPNNNELLEVLANV